jgi:hypothetical protein
MVAYWWATLSQCNLLPSHTHSVTWSDPPSCWKGWGGMLLDPMMDHSPSFLLVGHWCSVISSLPQFIKLELYYQLTHPYAHFHIIEAFLQQRLADTVHCKMSKGLRTDVAWPHDGPFSIDAQWSVVPHNLFKQKLSYQLTHPYAHFHIIEACLQQRLADTVHSNVHTCCKWQGQTTDRVHNYDASVDWNNTLTQVTVNNWHKMG